MEGAVDISIKSILWHLGWQVGQGFSCLSIQFSISLISLCESITSKIYYLFAGSTIEHEVDLRYNHRAYRLYLERKLLNLK